VFLRGCVKRVRLNSPVCNLMIGISLKVLDAERMILASLQRTLRGA
jgi:hypothetical protein